MKKTETGQGDPDVQGLSTSTHDRLRKAMWHHEQQLGRGPRVSPLSGRLSYTQCGKTDPCPSLAAEHSPP